MLLSTIVVKPSTIDGQGLMATQDIPQGCVVWLPCPECQVWSTAEIGELSEDQLQWLDIYAYTLDDGDILLPCQHAYQMNHSCGANVLDFGLEFGVAVRDIQAGEEITCDYRSFSSDTPWVLYCHCNAPECVGTIRPTDGHNPEVQNQWVARLLPVLPLLERVQQPLHDILMQCCPSYHNARINPDKYIFTGNSSIRKPSFLMASNQAWKRW